MTKKAEHDDLTETTDEGDTLVQDDVSNTDAGPDAAQSQWEAKLADLQAKADENWDKAVRATAELENVRRRAERDLENAHKYALEKFLHELIPIKDSLEMGLAAAQTEDADVNKLREGSELILKMLSDALEKFGIEVVDPMGDEFNPEHHQAMSMLESPDHAPNTVVAVMQKGYKLNDRLVRPAMVAVSKAPENDPQG